MSRCLSILVLLLVSAALPHAALAARCRTFGDPARPMGGATGALGGQSIPIKVEQARLQVDELPRAVTIWTDDVHGTLDVEQDGGPFDPRRIVLHLEF